MADTTGADWEADRAALVAHELSFADFLDRRGLVLRSDLLGAWARWITPEFEQRRYDTWFFVAALPAGQRTRNASTEADRTVWVRPAEAAAGYDSGELLMMPPTIATLRELLPYGTAAEALAAAGDRDLTPVLARARLEGGEIVLSWPGHDEFTKHVAGGTAGSAPGRPAPASPGTRHPGGIPHDRRRRPSRPAPRRGHQRAGHRPRAHCVLAPNPPPMTLDGTNTWIVAEPDSDLAVVIDPGPLDDSHLRAVIATTERAGKRVALTLLTHGHPDHAEGAARFAELTRTPVRALDPALRLGDEGLGAGDAVTTGGLELQVVPTPGHTADSLSFHLPADAAVLTGDTVLGRGTTVVAHPDGRLGDYLDSLRELRSLTVDDGVRRSCRGTGRCWTTPRAPSSSISRTAPTGSPRSRPLSRPAFARPPRSSHTYTPTSTARCGRRPNCPSGPSSTT